MKKIILSIIALNSFLLLKSQNIIFNSQYDKLEWPANNNQKGGISGDDLQWSRLTLFHGHSIALQTGTNSVNNSKTRLYVKGDGNIGIGTIHPSEKLDIQGALKIGGTAYSNIHIEDRAWNGSHAILFNAKTSPNLVSGGLQTLGNTQFYNDGGEWNGSAGGIFFESVGGNMYFHTSEASTGAGNNIDWGHPEMIIRRSGNVGIGTSVANAKLTVNGKILCEEIEVIGDVPSSDYVFESDYDLKSLEEVERFIEEHKHLPEVPSAQEFKENGYKLGEMDDLLLRKVEELTLYVIELKKEISQLKTNH